MQVVDSQTITNLHFCLSTPNDTNIQTFCRGCTAFKWVNHIKYGGKWEKYSDAFSVRDFNI
jgi:hypothetical protein